MGDVFDTVAAKQATPGIQQAGDIFDKVAAQGADASTAESLMRDYTDWNLRKEYGLSGPGEEVAPATLAPPVPRSQFVTPKVDVFDRIAAKIGSLIPAIPEGAPSPVPPQRGTPSFAYVKYGAGQPTVTAEGLEKEISAPLLPVGQLVRSQIEKVRDDPTRWALNTVMDLGQLSADTIEGLSTPENIGILTALATIPQVGAARWAHKLVAAGFSAEMAKQSADKIVSGFNNAKAGNLRAAGRDLGSAVVGASFSVAAGLGIRGRTPGLGQPKAEARPAIPPEQVSAIRPAEEPTIPGPAEPATSRAQTTPKLPGKVVGFDADSGLPIVRREAPAEVPLVETPEYVGPERRLDRGTRMEVRDLMERSGETDPEVALEAVREAQRARLATEAESTRLSREAEAAVRGTAPEPTAPPVSAEEEAGPIIPPEVEKPAETAPAPAVIFGKEATYSGVKEIEARLGEEVSAPRLVIRQEGRGGSTWSVMQRYYGEKPLPSGKSYTGQLEDVLARGLSKASAKDHARDLLARVANVEAGGKLAFETPRPVAPTIAPEIEVPQLPLAPGGRVSKRTGFTKSQQQFLAERLEKVAPELPPYQGAPGEAATIRVPRDGEFTVPTQTAANALHKTMTGEPLPGMPEPKSYPRLPMAVSRPAPIEARTDVERALELYGTPSEAIRRLEAQKAAVEADPESYPGLNTWRIESTIQGLKEARGEAGEAASAAGKAYGARVSPPLPKPLEAPELSFAPPTPPPTPRVEVKDLPAIEQPTATPEVLSKATIMRTLQEELERPFSVGRFKEKALGIYKVLPEGIRLRRANDVMVALHEAGHHLNKLLWGTYNKPAGDLSINWKPLKPYRSELNPANSFGYKPSGRSWLPESFADFVQRYVSDPADAQKRAPKFFAFFEKELTREPELKALLVDLRGKLKDYVSQSPKTKVLAAISQTDQPGVRFSFNRLYTQAIDALRPIQQVVGEMAKKGGKPSPDDDAYTLGRLLAGWWGKADHFLNKGTFDPNTLEVTGKPLKEILKPWDGKLDDLRVYLLSKRALELGERGKYVGIDLGDARASVGELEKQYPTIGRTAQDIYDFEDATLRYLRDSGYVSGEEYAKIKALNQAHVPLYRLFEESPFTGGPGLSTAQKTDLWTPVKRLKGSGRQIVDPLESIIKNVYTFINLAERNNVAEAITRQAAKSEGSARWLEEVAAPGARPIQFTIEEIKKALSDAGADLSEADLSAVATIFRPSLASAKIEGILTVRDRGKVSYWQVHDKDLYRALQGMDQESSNFLIRMLSLPARLLRLGATSLGPEFIIRNPLRDAMDAFMQSRNGFIPGVDSVRGLFHAVGHDDLFWEWKRAGGEHAMLVSLDRTTLRQQLSDMLASKPKWIVRHPVEALRMLSEFGESATRLGEYARARARGKTPRQAALESREVTIDFARMGAKTRAMNSITAFWNAAVQGTDKFYRSHYENPLGSYLKGVVGLTIPTLLLWWANKDDPKYQELPQWRKDFFWNVSTKGTRLEKHTAFIAIPRPWLWGMTYATTFERIAQWIDTKDPHAFDDYAKNVWQSWGPGMIPTALIPFVEAFANKSLYRGTPIEPQGMQNVLPEFRYTSYSSEFSKTLSKGATDVGLPVSPLQIDNALFSWTGGAGRAITQGIDIPLRRITGAPPKPASGVAGIPMLRGFTVQYPTRSATSIQKLYDRLETLEQKYGTERLGRQGRIQNAPTMTVQEHGELRRLRAAREVLSNLNTQLRRVEASTQFGPQEKRQKIDALVEREIDVARRTIRKGEAPVPALPFTVQ